MFTNETVSGEIAPAEREEGKTEVCPRVPAPKSVGPATERSSSIDFPSGENVRIWYVPERCDAIGYCTPWSVKL